MFNRICARLRQDHRKQMFSRFSRQVLLISSAAVISAGTIGNVATFSHCEEAIQNRIQPVNEEVMILKQIRPACDKYERLDELHLSKKENQDWLKDHVIHGNLNKETGIEVYEIYKMSNEDELVCIIKFGSALNGYPGVVHGGITALMFDNSFGWLLLSSKNAQAAVTANLNVNYRRPIMPNTYAILRAKFTSSEARKINVSATLHDASGVLLADSTALFIKMR